MVKIVLRSGHVLLIDDADYELVSQYTWHADRRSHTVYAKANVVKADGRKSTVLLHRLLLPDSIEVDHINGNGLDNQRLNLRESDYQRNQWNRRKTRGTSKFKGVSWSAKDRRWQVHIRIDGRNVGLGQFKIEEDAARAYDDAARRNFGEFANTNFGNGRVNSIGIPSKVITYGPRCDWKAEVIDALSRSPMTAARLSELIKCEPKHVTSRLASAGVQIVSMGCVQSPVRACSRQTLYGLKP